ncbi:hypothetical protein DUNSADRAFT_30 [Dunaliella salina]|uniref:Encoded protein n=1 Tax=Dunaliella salina TaxID=3046 RepID=A0ABQ7HAM8_DUNSA|nr:hypothetical protein DUNSADRAFT_30 [Dunaliella salina]|eukprot:KAF5843908.1 hypothetical protein DUNSADRAFT_30 [Dunaliella salina]
MLACFLPPCLTNKSLAMARRHALLQAISRKLWFFMCWAHEHRNGGLFEGQLRAAVLDQWHQHQASVKPMSKQEALLASMAGNSQVHVKPLIEEQR